MVVKPQGEMSDSTKKTDLGLLEEDDEFEEFPTEGELYRELITYNIHMHFFKYNILIIDK